MSPSHSRESLLYTKNRYQFTSLGKFLSRIFRGGEQEEAISLDKHGQRAKYLKLRKKITVDLILLRGKERA